MDTLGATEAIRAQSREPAMPRASSNSSSTSGSVDSIERQDSVALARIASSQIGRKLSESASRNDPRLDPTSPDFDYLRWAQMAVRAVRESNIEPLQQGITFSNLHVSGADSAILYQETLLTQLTVPFRMAARFLSGRHRVDRRMILNGFDGLLRNGELLLVLGRPGSGCSTFLKTMSGHLGGLTLEPQSDIQFQGMSFKEMITNYRGEVAYNSELDEHFAHLTVGETLEFAADARAPRRRAQGISRSEYTKTVVQVVMAIFGLTHTVDTKVGDNFVRGVSGGERKRVSIAEMFLSHCRIGVWDNSTRGLDAASALKFVRALRHSSDMGGSCHAVAAYQASQSMYDAFDNVIVLYAGYEIYFGPTADAVAYFEDMGWQRDRRQISGDFLTAVTNPGERKARPGMEGKVPRTPQEFFEYWRRSPQYEAVVSSIRKYRQAHPPGGEDSAKARREHKEQQVRFTRSKSPYLLSVPMQVGLCMRRGFRRMKNDLQTTLSTVIVQVVLSLVIGSIFYNSPNSSAAFFQKGAVLFFSVLMNALITINEIMLLYVQRPVTEKQRRYAFVRPFTEALAGVIVDLPVKLLRCSVFCVVLYFMANLRTEPSQFFIFYMFIMLTVLTMSAMFRSLAALTKSIGQAMAIAGLLVLCIVIYTGFTLPEPKMHVWFSWIRWLNPIFYAFEALIVNEFHGREFACAGYIPPYGTGNSFVCSSVGSFPGEKFVPGDRFIGENYNYSYSHVWRNLGILIAFLIFFNVLYLAATEYVGGESSKAEALMFRPGHVPRGLEHRNGTVEDGGGKHEIAPELDGPDSGDDAIQLPRQEDILSWRSVNYDIPVKGGTRRILDNVDGWVKPGTLTALMGLSGAGKTTLLDVLAQRVSIGVVTGEILVNGRNLTANFPRRTGYVQQQDLHLETTTVREALRFSAMLRQPRTVSKKDKYTYVEQVIGVLGMDHFAEAVVGSPGEGLNVEQRKLLSIGVELAARPTLLIFLDEPTSGLDSQSSWTICQFLRKLADSEQAVLATIHQPSAQLFQIFDRLLLLAAGGRTAYFGEIGENSCTMLDYFERNGAKPCGERQNPAEYILETVSGDEARAANWPNIWKDSPERAFVLKELDRLHGVDKEKSGEVDKVESSNEEFAMPFRIQLLLVMYRVFQRQVCLFFFFFFFFSLLTLASFFTNHCLNCLQYRQPEYMYSKYALGILSGLFIGFSFWKQDNSQQGFQDVLFGVFLLCTIFSTLVNQIMPKFVSQRALYEVRERPSRTYSWKVFILSQMFAEMPWQIGLGLCSWASFYWSVVGPDQSGERRALTMLFIVQFYLYAATMAQLVVCATQPAVGSMIATLMFGLSFIFNGVMQPPEALPGFWIFMWRVSPFTYYISGISSTILHGRPVQCSRQEMSIFDPPSGQTCGSYMEKFILADPAGRLYNPNSTRECEYCTMSVADQYLAQRRIAWDDRWRNYGIFWCYSVFNILAAILLYYLFRVRTMRAKVQLKGK